MFFFFAEHKYSTNIESVRYILLGTHAISLQCTCVYIVTKGADTSSYKLVQTVLVKRHNSIPSYFIGSHPKKKKDGRNEHN